MTSFSQWEEKGERSNVNIPYSYELKDYTVKKYIDKHVAVVNNT